MLIQLSIENLVLIEKASLSFGPGLNVLTGETGAGKSIIVDAMSLLLGGRALAEQIRIGAERVVVEGFFDCQRLPWVAKKLEEFGLPVSEDGSLLLAREVVRGGRSICRVNGRIVPLAIYRVLGELLVDLHGQHEHQSLLKVDRHRELLDHFCGKEVLEQRELVRDLYQRLAFLKIELGKHQVDEREIRHRIDYLSHVVEEIDRVKPSPGEEGELERERERLRYREKLAELAKEVAVGLYEGTPNLVPAYDLLSQAVVKLGEMSRYDLVVKEIFEALEGMMYKLEDVIHFIRQYRERLDFDPERAVEVEERVYLLRNLMRKYGDSLAAVCTYRNKVAAELEDLRRFQDSSQEMQGEYERVLDEYKKAAQDLSELRQKKAVAFMRIVEGELRSLGMEKACFDIMWTRLEEPTPWGCDRVEFLFSANPGEPLKPLAKIASGGEMSRVMLALKVIFAENDEIPTLIFDEIDTGIGGRTLRVVGERLASVAHAKQVLCVTHSPHIAGRGQRHFYIEKIVEKEKTRTVVQLLERQERVEEIIRMLGGGPSNKEATRLAEQILQN